MTSSFEPEWKFSRGTEFHPDVVERFEATGEPRPAADPAPESEEAARIRVRAEGFAEGREEGRREAAERLVPALRALERAASELAEQRNAWLHAQRGLLVELALLTAERIVGEALRADPAQLSRRIAGMLEATDPNQPVVVALDAQDYAALADHGQAASLAASVSLVSDPSLSPGDAVIRQGSATIDARLATLLAEARERLSGLRSVTGTITRATAEEEDPS